jgi:hypothetical protein
MSRLQVASQQMQQNMAQEDEVAWQAHMAEMKEEEQKQNSVFLRKQARKLSPSSLT